MLCVLSVNYHDCFHDQLPLETSRRAVDYTATDAITAELEGDCKILTFTHMYPGLFPIPRGYTEHKGLIILI